MANNSSLYGNNPPTQDIPSSNSTSLYSGPDRPIPDSSGNLLVRGDLAVNGGDITTTAHSASIFNTNAETLNIGGESTALSLGANTGTTTVNNNLAVGIDLTVANDAAIGNDLVVGNDLAITNDLTVGNNVCIVGDTLTLRCDATTPGSALIEVDRGGGSAINAQFAWDEDYPVPPSSNPNGRWVANAGITATGMTAGYVDIAPNNSDALITTYPGSSQNLILDSDTDTINLRANLITTKTSINVLNTTATTVNAFGAATTLNIGASLDTSIGIGQNTIFQYDENNDRLNRPNFQSSTGNTSGVRVIAPNATTNAGSVVSAFSTNDLDNGKFININARGNLTTPFRIQTGEYAGGVLGSSGDSLTFVDGNTTYATINPAGPTNPLDLTTKAYVDALPANITYTIDASTTTGGANFNLVGSDATTDTVKFASGTGVTVTRTDANTITTSIGQSVDTTASPSFLGATLGNIKVGVTTDNTIDTSSGNLTIAPATGIITVSAPTTVQWAEGGDLTKRFTLQSSSGNVTGVRTLAPNATSSAQAQIGAFSSNDLNNGHFINLQANNSGTDQLRIFTGQYISGTLNSTGGVAFYDNAATYATVNPLGPTNNLDLITKDYFDTHTGGTTSQLVNGTYTFTLDSSGILSSTTNDPVTIVSNSSVSGVNSTFTLDPIGTMTYVSNQDVGGGGSTLSVGPSSLSWVKDSASAVFPTVPAGTWSLNYDNTTSFPNFTFPAADGTSNQVLRTNGSGVLSWYSPSDLNTTYDFNATSTTGGANLNLVGSDSTTDTVKLSNGTGVTVSQVSGTEVSVAIGQDVATSASPSFVGMTLSGDLAVNGSDITTTGTGTATLFNTNATTLNMGGAATAVSIGAGTGTTSVNNNLAVTGTGTITGGLINGTRVLGGLTATTNNSYNFPLPSLTTITDNNGLDAASSFTTAMGNGAQQQITQYFGDTFAGTNTSGNITFRSANGNSVGSGTVPFTGNAATAPSASASGDVLGTLNFSGYGSTEFTNYVASRNQGGGRAATQNIQFQGLATEAYVEGTLSITPTAVTRTNTSWSGVSVTGTRGQISLTSSNPSIGAAVVVTGTNSGTSTGITAGTYYIIAVSGTTACTLSATPGGVPITTTAGTTTGLSFARQIISFTYSAQTYIPFGQNALVTISNITGVTNGTYMAVGTSTITSMNVGAPSSAVSLGVSPTITCLTVTNGGAGFRIRAVPNAVPMNTGNRIELVNHNASSAVYRSDSFTFQTGTGLTATQLTGDKLVYNRVYGQFAYNTTVTPVAANTAYVFPLGTADISNIVTVGSTSRIIPGAAGIYNLQFSVQVANADNGSEHFAYIWLRKNGTDVTNSMGRVSIVKSGNIISAWNYLISSANTTDYWEIGYAVDSTQVTFPFYTSTAFGPSTAALITTLTPVGT